MKKVLLAIVMLSSISFFTSCNSSKGGDPKATLISFIDALSKNDTEAASKLATKDSKSMIDMMSMGMKMGKKKKWTISLINPKWNSVKQRSMVTGQL